MEKKSENLDERDIREMRERRGWVNVALAILILIALAVAVSRTIARLPEQAQDTLSSQSSFVVEITGAVINPGKYPLMEGDTTRELIILAGGLSDGADVDSISMSDVIDVKRGVVRIPYRADYEPPEKLKPAEDVRFPLDLNTASVAELMALPGIGPKTAAAIVRYREEKGFFGKPEDILNVVGIGVKTYEKLYGLITVGES